jgi:hypothetical protein
MKTKRKRINSIQLKALNEVYDRSPFPTTAERKDLAGRLKMKPRNVRIWWGMSTVKV